MSTLRDSAQRALEALESAHPKPYNEYVRAHYEAIEALRAALAQQEQEHQPGCALLKIPSRDCDCRQEQEPVAIVEGVVPHLEVIIIKHILGARFPKIGDFLYTHPPRREWRSLSEEEVWSQYQTLWPFHPAEEPRLAADISKFARAIEAALKEKNNG